MLKWACAKKQHTKVAEILASGGSVQQPKTSDRCPACETRWDATHMLVLYEAPDPSTQEKVEERERRQLSILLLELAEEFFLRAHKWKKRDDGYFQPPENYRFRKDPGQQYNRSHAINSQKQVYSPLYKHEKQWEDTIAYGRIGKVDSP